MKKLFILTVFIIVSSHSVFAQEIILTFSSITDTLQIDSIQVTHLATNESLTVPGGKSIKLSDFTTNTKIFRVASENNLVYPNPFQKHTTLQYSVAETETIKLTMVNPEGKTIISFDKYLLPGKHHFKVTAKFPGIYFINILTEEENNSFKLISLANGNHDEIEYTGLTGQSSKDKLPKSALRESFFHFKIFSGNNSTIIVDNPSESKTYSVEFHECRDADGQHYPIVQIGSQWWMAQNLALLPSVSPPSLVSNTEKYYYVYGYDGNDVSIAKATDNYNNYGVLYNWSAVMNGSASSNANPSGIRGICPEGWHLPSHAEWTQLEDYLIDNGYNYDRTSTDNQVAKALAATILWSVSTIPGETGTDLSLNNKSGFSALPGGICHNVVAFDGLGFMGCWWACTETYPDIAWCRLLTCCYKNSIWETYYKQYGISVRCIKD